MGIVCADTTELRAQQVWKRLVYPIIVNITIFIITIQVLHRIWTILNPYPQNVWC